MKPVIHFYCRKSRASKKTGLATIEMSIGKGEDRKYFPLEMKANPDEFKKSMLSKRDNDIKSFCRGVEMSIGEIVAEMVRRGIPRTTTNIFTYYTQGGIDKIFTLDELFAEFNEIRKKEYDAGLMTKITYDRYLKTKDLFYDLCGLKGNENVNTITIQHWKIFEAEMAKRFKASYTCGFQKKLKAVFKYAFDTGKISAMPFVNVKINRGSTEIQYLTDEELRKIAKMTFNTEKLNRVKDIFLFDCYTGLSLVDLKKLKKDDFYRNDVGQWCVKGKRQKTGKEFVIALFGEALDIARKYDFTLPFICDQDYNRYLKDMGTLCDIDKPFSSKLARSTCACHLLNKGCSYEEVARILGDSVQMVQKHYAVLFDDSVYKAIQKVEDRTREEKEKQDLIDKMTAILEGDDE